jgi:hypothetical protein
VNNDTIYSKNISITDDFLEYALPDDEIEHKIPIKSVKGYYSKNNNAYYEKKEFNAKTRSGFLGLKYKKQDYFDFVELIFDGKIKAYRGIEYRPDPNHPENINNYWFFEKGDSLQIGFTADKNNGGFMKLKKARYFNLNKDFFETIFSDDKKAQSAVQALKKNNKGRLTQIRNIVNDYNNRHYEKNTNQISNESMSYVTLLRDSRKEIKKDLVLSVNNISYILPRNSKLKVKISSESNTMVCLENSENEYCRLISSSRSFPKFYKVILNKDNQGDIFKINGLSSFYKVRLENYESVD